MRPLITVVGPTAVGKTDLGLRLAGHLDGEIINADALQVYRGLDIGTAKPTPAERRAVVHHLVDFLEPTEAFSAGEFVRLARPLIDEIRARDHTPIVVGGSGFYVRALLEGLSPLPPSDPQIRRDLEEELEKVGLESLYEELQRVDPATAQRLAPRDRQRILRALEVERVSGRPLAEWIAQQPAGKETLAAVKLGLTLPRSILYDRVARRAEEMISRGWVQEVEALLGRGVDPGVPAFQAIGYRQIVQYVQGGWTMQETLEDIVRATRRYAKRQMTWFRKEKDVQWIPANELDRGLSSLLDSSNLEVHSLDEQA